VSADVREKGATPKSHGAKSDAVREAAILALLTERSIQLAAERCGVNEQTLRRLTEDMDFRTEYDTARRAVYHAGMARVQALTGKGVETLEELLDAKKFPAVRHGAARCSFASSKS
jgi:phosphoserine phosphatase